MPAFSAPAATLAIRVASTLRVMRGGDERSRRAPALLGAAMVPGYLAEEPVRRRLRRSGWDRRESPLVVLGITTAGLMVPLGLSPR